MSQEKMQWMEYERYYCDFVFKQVASLKVDECIVVDLGGESIYKFRATLQALKYKSLTGKMKFSTKKAHKGSIYWLRRIE